MAGKRQRTNSQKALAGNSSGRALIGNDVDFVTELGNAPAFLTKTAQTEWNRVSKELRLAGVVKAVDRAALAGYCMSYARWREAEEILERDGILVKEPVLTTKGELKGYRLKRHPACTIATTERASMRAFGGLFGLDPSSRRHLTVQAPAGKDPLAALLDGDDEQEPKPN